jgi:hypothetical protein
MADPFDRLEQRGSATGAPFRGCHPAYARFHRNEQSFSRIVELKCPLMAEWSFLTNHARVLVCIAHDPGVRLRDIATTLHITERSAYSIVADLTAGGYVVKDKDGRRNRYQIQPHLRLPEAITEERTIGEVLDLLVDSKPPGPRRRANR